MNNTKRDYKRTVDLQLLLCEKQIQLSVGLQDYALKSCRQAAVLQIKLALDAYAGEVTSGGVQRMAAFTKSSGSQADFRLEEIQALLTIENSWLQKLLAIVGSLVNDSHVASAFDAENGVNSQIIASSKALEAPHWSSLELTELSVLLSEFKMLVARQRELAWES